MALASEASKWIPILTGLISRRTRFVPIVAVVAVLLLLICIGIPFAEWPFVLLFGWIVFLVRTLPQVTVEPAALGVAAVGLLLSLGLVHYLARWLYCRIAAGPGTTPPVWRFRWSLATVSLVAWGSA